MRATSAIFACVIASLLICGYADDESYWKPSEAEREQVSRVVVSVPPKCEGALHPQTRDFLGNHYQHYPETNFTAVWLPGDPKLVFYDKEGAVLREVSLVRYEVQHIITVLAAWGFRKDAEAAKSLRMRNMIASSHRHNVPKAPELIVENGKVVMPAWFENRKAKLEAGELNPDDASGVPKAPSVEDGDLPWFMTAPSDPDTLLADLRQDGAATEAIEAIFADETEVDPEEQFDMNRKDLSMRKPVGPSKPIEAILKPGERKVYHFEHDDAPASVTTSEEEVPAAAPHDEL